RFRRPVFITRQTGTDRSQRRGHLGMLKREIDGDAAAEREANKMRLFDVEELEELVEIVDVRVWLGCRGRLPEAPDVVADDANFLGKDLELVVPHPSVELPSMDQNNGNAVAGDLLIVERWLGDHPETALDRLGVVHVWSLSTALFLLPYQQVVP